MKYLVLFIILFGALHINAQENIEVKMTELAIDSSMQPAFVVEIPQTDDKTAIKMWEEQLVPKNLLSTFKKLPKMEKEDKDKWYINGIVVDEICPDTLSVYTRITSLKDRIIFATLFKSPDGFIGTDQENNLEEQRASAYLRRYTVEVYKHAVQDELDELEKELKKMENNYSSFDKDNRKLEKKSTESESSLKIMNSSGETSNVLTDEQMKEKQKEIKKEERALKKYENKIDKNSDKQKKLSRDITKKEEEIKSVEEKLRNIK